MLSRVPDDPRALDAWLAEREGAVDALRPSAAKHIVWAGDAGAVTELAVVYIHGFSASLHELRPMPDQVAAALGANLHFGRLAGHGRDGKAMAEPSATDWMASAREAIEVGRRIGQRVLLITCSTGSTLAAIELAKDARQVAGVVMVSPNWRLKAALPNAMLRLPGLDVWAPRLLTQNRGFEPRSEGHAQHWTTSYPMSVIVTMRDALKAADELDLSQLKMPMLTIVNEGDIVIDPDAAKGRALEWGGPRSIHIITPEGEGWDENGHILAGDIISPSGTTPVREAILKWWRSLDV
ncbi:MAG: alpha/beta hydrolase [Shimia sp.]